MKKKLLIILGIVLVICIIVVIIISTRKKPETTSIVIATKDGIKNSDVDSLKYVGLKEKILKSGKNTMTDKKTGKTVVYEYIDVEYEILAVKEGKTTLSLEYIDPKTNETKNDIYNIEVNKDLKITVNKQ